MLTPQHRPPVIYDPLRAPGLWVLWLGQLGAPDVLARQLWRVFRAQATAGEIAAVLRAARRKDRRAVLGMLAVVTPARLLRLLGHLAPEGQGERPREVRDVESVIVARARGPQAWK